MEESIKLNKVKDLVTIYPVGVGSGAARATLENIDESNIGAQSLKISQGTDSDIDVISIDSLGLEETVTAIKIDVEGMELDVLDGAETLIKKDKPLLAIEAASSEDYMKLESFIKRNDYIYCSSFNGTPTHFFIHQDKVSNSPWLDLFFDKGAEFYQMRHYHKKLKQTLKKLEHK